MNLQHYHQVKFRIAEILRDVRLPDEPGRPVNQTRLRDVFARLAEDRFNLVVVGRFSRGKTSLMNAMLRTARLPTGVVPVTSVITTVGYGTHEKVVLHYYNSGLIMDIPIDQLETYVAERGNPGNRRNIQTAEVQLPADILRNGFHFIDTPGLGSSIMENTRTTEAFLPEADAFILVTSFDSPLSEEEQRIVRIVAESGRRIFVVVNKQDAVGAEDRHQVLDYLKAQLSGLFHGRPVPMFSLSAQQALAASLVQDGEALKQSGIEALESALVEFLVNEKRREFLLSILTRIEEILRDYPDTAAALRTLAALRVEISGDPAAVPASSQAVESIRIDSIVQICEICAQVDGTLFDFLAHFQYQLRGDPQVRADLAKRGGVCAPHLRQVERIAAPREICTGFALVLTDQADRLRALSGSGASVSEMSRAVRAALPTVKTCLVCDAANRAAEAATRATALRLRQNPRVALRSLSAICPPHLGQLITALGDADVARLLLERQAAVLDRLADDMRRFALKQDAARRYLASEEELGAAGRGLRALSGHPNAQVGPPA